MGDSRIKILAEARRILEEQEVSMVDRDTLFRLLDILTLAVEKYLPEQADQLPNLRADTRDGQQPGFRHKPRRPSPGFGRPDLGPARFLRPLQRPASAGGIPDHGSIRPG